MVLAVHASTVGYSDPLILHEKVNDHRIKGTPGITGL